MKISEIICEDESAEDQLAGPSLDDNLLPVLMFLKKQSDDREVTPKLRTDSLIQLVQNAGDLSFSYDDLVSAHENNDAVKELISSFNEDEVTLKSGNDNDEEEHDSEGPAQDPQAVVHSMAQKARNDREQ
jgi:hypothetical protein